MSNELRHARGCQVWSYLLFSGCRMRAISARALPVGVIRRKQISCHSPAQKMTSPSSCDGAALPPESCISSYSPRSLGAQRVYDPDALGAPDAASAAAAAAVVPAFVAKKLPPEFYAASAAAASASVANKLPPESSTARSPQPSPSQQQHHQQQPAQQSSE